MSRIAQKLCEEIVNPAWRSYTDDTLYGSTPKHVYDYPSKPNANAGLRPVIVEKKRVINKVLLPTSSKSTKNDYQSKHYRNDTQKATVLKRFVLVNRGLNTLISGPLRCDNNCVTDVRKRDKSDKVCCKCTNQSHLTDKSSKEVQTMDSKRFTSLSHKACSHCIEMVSNSTQFHERMDNPHEVNASRFCRVDILSDGPAISTVQPLTKPVISADTHETRGDILSSVQVVDSKPTYMNNFKGARRWALSQCPVLGPDF